MASNHRSVAKRLLVPLLVVLAGVTAGVLAWQLWPHECGGAFSGFRYNDQMNKECIGITDGSFLFNDPDQAPTLEARRLITDINEVQKKIELENRRVSEETNRYVKVVLLMPITISESKPSAVSLEQILYSLQGSYTALVRANDSPVFGDPSAVQLQLLLANQGSRQEAGSDFLEKIAKAAEPDHPVVAVVGLGSSVPNTQVAAEYFVQQEIPMISAVTSADVFSEMPLLWSVSPSNREYARALRSFLDSQDELTSGVVVYDENNDLYTLSLAEAFHSELEAYLKFPRQPYQGSTIESRAAPNVFVPVVTSLCNAAYNPDNPLDVVFYAGRIADFGAFADALAVRICRDRPLTILTGATGFASAQNYKDRLVRGNVTVAYASSSDYLAWGNNESGTPTGYEAFLEAYRSSGFHDDAGLADGYAMAHHHALVSAARAIRLASQGLAAQGQVPSSQDVIQGMGRLSLAHTVQAASGTLTFEPGGGRASGRTIPIRQVE